MLDIAPYYLTAIASLLGPFAAATGFAATPTPRRTLAVGPRAGEQVSSTCRRTSSRRCGCRAER